MQSTQPAFYHSFVLRTSLPQASYHRPPRGMPACHLASERLTQHAPEFPAMPRPKVDPANRLRANMACLSCRISKRRCTGTFPCPSCIHRGLMASCGPSPRTDAGAQSRDASTTGPAPACNPVDSPVSNPSTTGPPSAGSAGAQHRTHPRMLWNRQGERGMGQTCTMDYRI